MKYFCQSVVLIFLLMTFGCQHQAPVKELKEATPLNTDTVAETETYDLGDPSCIYKKSDKTISGTYPFSKADYIEVVSYPNRSDSYTNDTLIVNGKFTVKGIEDRIRLNKKQTDSLFSILYDYTLKEPDAERSIADCYVPRHSVLFYKDKKPFVFLEVCLECGGMRTTEDVYFGDFCGGKMSMLHSFFRSIGVKHEMDEYYR